MTLEQINESYKMKIAELEAKIKRLKGSLLNDADIQGALARGYCSEQNSSKEVDCSLIMAMTYEIIKAQQDKLKEVK